MREIFVFGSNLDGNHGAGAARFARVHYRAKMGIAEGMASVESYALPTVGHKLSRMDFETLKIHVARFIAEARSFPEWHYKVTRIGCERAGFTDAQVAPLFIDASPNCRFDTKWRPYLKPEANFWGTY